MTDLEKNVQELIMELQKIHYSWTRVTAALWSPEEGKKERAREEKLKNELKKIVPERIKELEEEKQGMISENSKFFIRLYRIFGRPKKAENAEKRISQINCEIQELRNYFK